MNSPCRDDPRTKHSEDEMRVEDTQIHGIVMLHTYKLATELLPASFGEKR